MDLMELVRPLTLRSSLSLLDGLPSLRACLLDCGDTMRVVWTPDSSFLVKPKPRTMTPEWEEATRQRALENKQNPFTGAYAQALKESKA